jgi:methyltransferase (TIGR00027 family)
VEPAQGSKTAESVAAVRAGHFLYDQRPLVFEDPFAVHLTGPLWRLVVRSRPIYWLVARQLLRGLRPVHAQLLARGRYAEDELEKAVTRGTDQYVILGAGLDSFAWRRTDLASKIRVYELDHPATQRAKRDRLERLGFAVPENLDLIAVDFERETVADALARSSYHRDRPGFFTLLGTIQYIPRESVMATLRSVREITARGSELVLTYNIPLDLVEPADRRSVERVMRFAARRGEPFISLFDPRTFPDEVCALGFQLVENCSPKDQERRYFAGRTDDLRPLSSAYVAHFRV